MNNDLDKPLTIRMVLKALEKAYFYVEDSDGDHVGCAVDQTRFIANLEAMAEGERG